MEKGFTLMEVLVALALLSLALLAFTNLFVSQINNITLSGKKSVALYDVQETIENLYLANEVGVDQVQVAVAPTSQLKIKFSNDIEVSTQGKLVEVETEYQKFRIWVTEPSGGGL